MRDVRKLNVLMMNMVMKGNKDEREERRMSMADENEKRMKSREGSE